MNSCSVLLSFLTCRVDFVPEKKGRDARGRRERGLKEEREKVGEEVTATGGRADQSVRRRRAVWVQRRGKEALMRSARNGTGRGR
jgi:hypothetical protein